MVTSIESNATRIHRFNIYDHEIHNDPFQNFRVAGALITKLEIYLFCGQTN